MKKHRESGQAAVETAIVMPLFVFTLLGLLQLGLLHQSRLLAKYAAYKAVRAGSINRGKVKTMENAAIAVMLPMLAKASPRWSGSGRHQPQYMVYNVASAGSYKSAFAEVSQGRGNTAFGKPMVNVTVCGPLSNEGMNKDFDDHRINPGEWKKQGGFETTKLAIQVTAYMPLYIPFANAFIWWAARGQEGEARRVTMKNLRMKTKDADDKVRKAPNGNYTLLELENEANNGNYIMPVRASFSMRMHSNFIDEPPTTNLCHVPWEMKNK